MSVGLDSEGLLAIYADWIAFLREKKGPLEGQLAKVQAKGGGGKEKSVVSPVEPPPPAALSAMPEASTGTPGQDETAPAWLFEASPVSEEGGTLVPAPAISPPADEDADTWL